MLNGSQEFAGTEIRRKLATYGGVLSTRVNQDALEFTVRIPAGATRIALEMLGEIVCHPRLLDSDIDAGIDAAKRVIMSEPSSALVYAERISEAALYRIHPYASRGRGTYGGVSQLSGPIVRWAYQTYIVPRTTVMALVGRVKHEDVMPIVREVFGSWPGKPRPPRAPSEPPLLKRTDTLVYECPVRNTCVMLTFPVCGINDPDFLPLRLTECLLSGGTGARLFRAVREREQLAYEVSTRFPSQVACSHFSIYAITSNRHMEATRAAIVTELLRLQTESVPAAELQRAKAYLKSRYLLGHQFSSQYAYDLAWYVLQDFGLAFDTRYLADLEKITAADIQRVANSWFTRYLLTVTMPFSLDIHNQQGMSLNGSRAGVQSICLDGFQAVGNTGERSSTTH
jgi:zinc protease